MRNQEHLEEKMKVPQVSISVWKDIYQAAAGFRALRPWEMFRDSDVFGIKNPGSEEIGYCCVFGALGEVFALCMYRGGEGLDSHQRTQRGEINPAIDDCFAMQNALMAEFCDRKELEKEDLAIIRELGFKPQKDGCAPAYPCFRDYTPGFAPWFISENDARWLTFALRCATDFIEAVEEDGSIPEPKMPGHYLVYFPRDNGDKELSWTKKWHLPQPFKKPSFPQMPVDELCIRKILKKPLRQDTPWEIDVFHLSGGVILDRDRPYYSRCAMLAHKESGFLLGVEMPEPDRQSHLVLRDVLLKAIEQHGLLPAELHVRDELAWKTLKPLTDKLGCALKQKQTLPAILEAKQSLNQQMRRGFR